MSLGVWNRPENNTNLSRYMEQLGENNCYYQKTSKEYELKCKRLNGQIVNYMFSEWVIDPYWIYRKIESAAI